MKRYLLVLISTALFFPLHSCGEKGELYDVVIVGGGTSGTAAGIQAARMGARTLVVEEFDWLGGMLTSAGVSATDGNYKLRGGLWGEFRDSLESHYGGAGALKTGWVSNVLFEPSVGDRIFKDIAAGEESLDIWYRSTVRDIARDEGGWTIAVDRDGTPRKVKAGVLVDATELGDVAASLGVAYDIGMDSRSETGESIAPEKANGIIQDLTYVMVLKDYGRDMTIAEPEGYDASMYACCCVNGRCISPKEPGRMWSREKMLEYGKLPNGKYMINWPIEGNDYYLDIIEMSPEERRRELVRAKDFSLGFLYFIQTELGLNTLGLADDEFPTGDRLPFIPYHRESRRIDGAVRFTVNHIIAPYGQPEKLYRTAIGVGDYPVDHHHMRYTAWEELPDLYFHPVPSYGVPMGVMIPKGVEGLIVAEKSVSVTNIVNGSTRLQPVVLQIGQAAGALAALAVRNGTDVSAVGVREVQGAILDAGGYLLPFLDLPASDPHFAAMQRIGVTGIIKGEGANAGWENQTWFHADRPATVAGLYEGALELIPSLPLPGNMPGYADAGLLAEAFGYLKSESPRRVLDKMAELWEGTLLLKDYDPQRPLTRLECAVLIDHFIDPFGNWAVDVTGEFKDI